MKRVEGSKRGEGKYEQISWDEALDTIASEFKRITEAYGNESVFIQECSGVEQNVMMNNPGSVCSTCAAAWSPATATTPTAR